MAVRGACPTASHDSVIGLLSSVTAREWAPFIAAFLQGLNEVGFVADLRPLGAAINADGATIDEIVSHHSCKIVERAGALAMGRSLRSAAPAGLAVLPPRVRARHGKTEGASYDEQAR